MDFWSRLIGSAGLSSSRALRKNTTAERLTAFKRTCYTLDQIWRHSPSQSPETTSIRQVRVCLDRLNSILGVESRGPAPHPCHAHAASSKIYLNVTKLALSYCDPGVIKSAAILFNTLIDAEIEGIVDNRLFARALGDFVRRAGSAGEEGEDRLVELLFGVANNIRLRPDILPAWFFPKENEEQRLESIADSGNEFAGATRKDDFPFFYLLVDYVHHEGRSGDFARTGLLYIIETASRSRDLEKWLIESDLATLMATGLGALYSQLGRKLAYSTEDKEVPHIIALSDQANVERARHIELGVQFQSFLSYLLFWQDTIDHCRSAEVNDTLLDHFEVLFLQQLLYPSLLESSDVDGGSTSVVITYLSRILESIDQPNLVHKVLHFLLASPATKEETPKIPKKELRMSLSRRKSLDLLASFAEAAAKPSPELFNLVDLVLMSIKSKNIHTVTATLRLIKVIVRRHQTFASSLIKATRRNEDGDDVRSRSIGALNAELSQLLNMATSILDDPSVGDSYGNYLIDASAALESLPPILPEGESLGDYPLSLQTSDGILNGVFDLLGRFFANSVMTNLALTDAITSLASSSLISLDGWVLVEPNRYKYTTSTRAKPTDSSDADGAVDASRDADPIVALTNAYEQPSWLPSDVPIVQTTIQGLIDQVQIWRRDIPDFDVLIAARRDLLHYEEPPETEPQPENNKSVLGSPSGSSVGRTRQPSLRPNADLDSSPRGRNRQLLDHSDAASPSPARKVTESISRSLFNSPPSKSPGSRAQSQTPSSSAAADGLRKRLAMPFRLDSNGPLPPASDAGFSDSASVDSSSAPVRPENNPSVVEGVAETETEFQGEKVSLGHVLTNTVILHEFILELAAIVQVRASLFQEVRF